MEKSHYSTDRSIKLLYSSDKTMMEFPYVKKRHRLLQNETLTHRKYTYLPTKYLGIVTQKLLRNKYKIMKMSKFANKQQIYLSCKNFNLNKIKHLLPEQLYSMPSVNTYKLMNIISKTSRSISYEAFSNYHKHIIPYQNTFIVYNLNEIRTFQIPFNNHDIKVFRCQLNTKEETCCCSCNSDAMFEVMKSLYDCYKKKNCDNCNCILCGHLPKEERKLGEIRKSAAVLGEGPEIEKKKKKMQKIKAGLTTPLEGKSKAQKEKILKGQAELGLPLPEGRPPSEKAMIAKVRATAPPPSVYKVPSAKMRKAKAEGLLTPLAGKSHKQKEKIVRGLAMNGIPLPEGKTPSERKLIDKVRAEVGLPPSPETDSAKKKYQKALAAGLITPLEGKTEKQKEKILKGQAELGLPLPKGRTQSEKALIEKVKATAPSPSVYKVPSAKMRKAKAEGLLTPLAGKSPEQKEKIVRGLAMNGIPLPESKTESERKLIDKVRAEVGLPPSPETDSAKKRYQKALVAGLITPLEGKTEKQKEKILKGQAELGLPLPEGRTPSEKALISKVRATAPPPSVYKVPSAKMRKAKAEGLLTPLAGKSPEQKEKIIRGLAMNGIPLPESKTESERKLIDKVRGEVGLPPSPETDSAKKRYQKALVAGLITPLEGKTEKQKEKILKGQAELGLPLPEGRTPSEKAMIAKVRATAGTAEKISEKLHKAKAAGLLTPLDGKTSEEKEKIVRNLAKTGLPLPEGKTFSEQQLIKKIRDDMGLPVTGHLPSEKFRKAQAAGLITPLAGKSVAQKEKILKGRVAAGLPLPEGVTPSDKKLIKKVKAATGYRSPAGVSPSEKMRRAKTAGLLTPLAGKTPEQKKKILKGLAKVGVPLPEGKTASEKNIISQVRKEVGLPPEPKTPSMKEKIRIAHDAGIITPLEGKTVPQKEKILRKMHQAGLQLPEGRTSSETALVKKIKAEPIYKVASKKFKAAKAAGLITPLDGKTNAQKENILRGLAKHGIPLPETKTASEKKIADKVRAEMGLPPEPKTSSTKAKYKKAIAAGLITPLEGKTKEQKKKILQGQADMGVPLPDGRTPSEKSLISKIKRAAVKPSGIPSERLREAKAAGLLTPLHGKTPEEKQNILKGLAKHGLAFPEPRTESERILTGKVQEKIKARPALPPQKLKKLDVKTAKIIKEGKGPSDECICDLLTPESERAPIGARKTIKSMKIPSEKLRQAKDEGLLTPLEGKSAKRKEEILRGLAEKGLPLPDGKTSSEKSLIRKVKKEYPLSPYEKMGKIKTKSKKVGRDFKSTGGIEKEYEDIIKTTTCDRGCGCDKKKIRFKHSYVKIRVTSPDMSSLCPCPEECVPGIKGGVCTDNEGIKVTVGRVLGIRPFPSKEFSKYKPTPSHSLPSCNLSADALNHTKRGSTSIQNNDYFKNSLHFTESDQGVYIKTPKKKIKLIKTKDSTNSIIPKSDNNRFKYNECQYLYEEGTSRTSSFQSIYIFKTESSLSLSRISNTISFISMSTSSLGNYFYSEYYETDYSSNHQLQEKKEKDNTRIISITSLDDSMMTDNDRVSQLTNSVHKLDRSLTILELSNLKTNFFDMHDHNNWNLEDDSLEDLEIRNILLRIISERTMHKSSSLIFLIQTSSEENSAESIYQDYLNSTICIQLSEKFSNRYTSPCSSGCFIKHQRGFKINKKHKKKISKDILLTLNKKSNSKLRITSNKSKNNIILTNNQDKQCQYTSVLPFNKIKKDSGRVFSTDTTQDRPCCCQSQGELELKNKFEKTKHTVENVLSELVTPMMLKEAVAQGLSREVFIEKTKTDFGCQYYSNKTKPHTHLSQKTPIGLCKVPPSCVHQGHNQMPDPTSVNMCPNHNDMKKSCDCDPDKMKMIFERAAKQLISRGCGNSIEIIGERKSNLKKTARGPGVGQGSSNTSCSSCNPKIFEGTLRCKCNGKEKKVKLPRLCPCGQHQMNTPPTGIESPDKKCACTFKKDKKGSKGNKNKICECPEEPEPELDFVEFIDEKLIKKIKSELTQTISGFKINIARKNTDSIMSFEEALKYYAEHPEDGPIYLYEEESCACRNKLRSKTESFDCSCPYDILPTSSLLEAELQEEPFTGIKFHIGGKGSGSKGLSGILCFDVI